MKAFRISRLSPPSAATLAQRPSADRCGTHKLYIPQRGHVRQVLDTTPTLCRQQTRPGKEEKVAPSNFSKIMRGEGGIEGHRPASHNPALKAHRLAIADGCLRHTPRRVGRYAANNSTRETTYVWYNGSRRWGLAHASARVCTGQGRRRNGRPCIGRRPMTASLQHHAAGGWPCSPAAPSCPSACVPARVLLLSLRLSCPMPGLRPGRR